MNTKRFLLIATAVAALSLSVVGCSGPDHDDDYGHQPMPVQQHYVEQAPPPQPVVFHVGDFGWSFDGYPLDAFGYRVDNYGYRISSYSSPVVQSRIVYSRPSRPMIVEHRFSPGQSRSYSTTAFRPGAPRQTTVITGGGGSRLADQPYRSGPRSTTVVTGQRLADKPYRNTPVTGFDSNRSRPATVTSGYNTSRTYTAPAASSLRPSSGSSLSSTSRTPTNTSGFSTSRSYSAPSAPAPTRSYSAPSTSYSAPSTSYSAPSTSYSSPSRSYSSGSSSSGFSSSRSYSSSSSSRR
jgi:hypothetical protein